jgi:kynureninase
MIDLQYCRTLDSKDPLRSLRERFSAGEKDTIYLDGNSIGAMPADAPARVEKVLLDGWRDARRRGWNRYDWLEKPWLMGEGVAHILGAGRNDVVFCDNTSVNLYKILGYAWQLDRNRPVIVTETWNFPTDMYVAEGLVRFAGGDASVRRIDTPEQLDAALKPDVGVLYLSHVDYRSSRRWDMAAVNKKASALGILTLWDCSHSAGAVAVDLAGTDSDFAVGCGYKYLCGGPGSPAWLYVNPKHQNKAWPVIAGWMGHEDLFAFGPTYAPIEGVRRQLTGTPGIIANEAMAAAVDIWKDVKVADLDWKHRSLSETLIRMLEEQCGALGVKVTCPRKYEERGGAVIFSHPGAGSVTEALLAHGVVSSFRKPDSIRFGVSPVALSHEDLWNAVARLRDVLRTEVWRDAKFSKVSV